ncbi:uncharacterized protein CC84DRAFT_1229726 [Paraphaeosphaeria sporulosa]|uniref:P-loop containing nucleoside triphosphate hydrolase protein n=1 Tax=Paraphaeosphaeria sporulosa TaxID=1460663 RepID=A0A177BZT8_9PLEO|nr:uncharacterized protein CC84DRAFT_1229726 [Paraphaeosphaeria sporulosa]OAG01054.1 hypothetical protein CC84DRAFT_1229726 [Paraphaeosphaeria sporulosa]
MVASESYKELARYQAVLADRQPITSSNGSKVFDTADEELRMAPLVWWEVKTHFEPGHRPNRGYGVLGHIPNGSNSSGFGEAAQMSTKRTPVLLNIDSPWSAFLCGSQGSGKSHSLSCMLENCLLSDHTIIPKIGFNPHQLAGLVFHYDRCQGSGVCEAAYLCTNVPTTVLTILIILRGMAIESQGLATFDYEVFKRKLNDVQFARGQDGPMRLRLDLLESFMEKDLDQQQPMAKQPTKRRKNPPHAPKTILAMTENDFLIGTPGTLTIIDLTDPVIDPDAACALFDICLSVFIQQTQCGKIVALDEAHNYMTESGNSAKTFTEKLLRTVREQRHQAVRVVVATQEPSINPQLLDLCSITMVHRSTSPAWFKVLKQHIAAIYLNSLSSPMTADEDDKTAEIPQDDKALFNEIVKLKLGESLLFCPTAAFSVLGRGIRRMEGIYVKFKTRQRVTADGGKSKLAAETSKADSESGQVEEN